MLLNLPTLTSDKIPSGGWYNGFEQGCGAGTGRNHIHLGTPAPEPEPYSEYDSGSGYKGMKQKTQKI